MTRAYSRASLDWHAIDDEVIMHLQNILRLDTRNPPGNEIRAAHYLRDVLEKEGFECVIVGPSPDRASLITRLKGDGSAPPLLLMSHTDVVAVEPDKWSHDPFAAVIDNGILYGRGALDMKNMVTMELMCMLLLKRAGVPLKRDVIYMAAADEETGGQKGAGWVVEHYPELIQAEYALNEGGGGGLEVNGQVYYTVQTAEKGSARFRIRTTGTPGHGSVPHNDNAIVKLAEYLSKVRDTQPPTHLIPTVRGYIEGIARTQKPELAAALRAVLADEQQTSAAIDKLPLSEQFRRSLQAMTRNTISPTMLTSGSQINVIPSEAVGYVDGRLLPGQTMESFRAELHEIFGAECDIEFVSPAIPLETDPASPLFEVIKEVLHEHAPTATVVPSLLTGGTDAKSVSSLGTKIYGFAPVLYTPHEGRSGVHGHDERIHVKAMQWGTRVLYDVVEKFVQQA